MEEFTAGTFLSLSQAFQMVTHHDFYSQDDQREKCFASCCPLFPCPSLDWMIGNILENSQLSSLVYGSVSTRGVALKYVTDAFQGPPAATGS